MDCCAGSHKGHYYEKFWVEPLAYLEEASPKNADVNGGLSPLIKPREMRWTQDHVLTNTRTNSVGNIK